LPDLNFQDLSTVQSNQQQKPLTLASAATVVPLTFLTFITGTVAIANITPPVSGSHMLAFIFTTTTPTAFTTTGNVKVVQTPTQNIPTLLIFDPIEGKYWPGELTA